MANRNNPGEKLSAAGIRLQRGETAVAALALAQESNSEASANRACLVLSDQRIFYIPDASANPQVQSAPLQDVGNAEIAKQPRYHAFLLPAGYFLVIGISYFIATAIAGAFQGIVLVPTLLLGGGFLAMWCYSGGDTVIRVELGDTQLEGLTGRGQRREGTAFLGHLTEAKGKIT